MILITKHQVAPYHDRGKRLTLQLWGEIVIFFGLGIAHRISLNMGKPSMKPHYGTLRNYPLERGPHEFFEDQVLRTPDAPALTLGSEQISYRELNSRSNRLAHFLREQGVGPESLVGVFLDRSYDSIVSLLAILKSGGTYLPLDPRFPKDRLAFMLADSEVSLLLSHSSKEGSLPETTAQVVLLDEAGDVLSHCQVTNLPSLSNPEHLAYLIYTSGSTGKPKGVMIPRRALANFLLSMQKCRAWLHPTLFSRSPQLLLTSRF